MLIMDIRHFGRAIKHGRETTGLNQATAAKLLGITKRELSQYERSRAPVPENVLFRISTMAFFMLRARNFIKKEIK